jgi:hypothetical protein
MSTGSFRSVLMSIRTAQSGNGFNELVFRISVDRSTIQTVTVLISNDAQRKLAGQLTRARMPKVERDQMLKLWAKWELAMRAEEGTLPSTLTITASDLDEYGAYATDFGRSLLAS